MQSIQPSQVPVPTASFVPGVKSGPFVFVSGQVGIDMEGRPADPHDMRAQTLHVLRHVRLILEEVGGTLDDVVKTTVYITDFDAYTAFDTAYSETFGSHKPAREVVKAGLLRPGLMIELSAIAIVE